MLIAFGSVNYFWEFVFFNFIPFKAALPQPSKHCFWNNYLAFNNKLLSDLKTAALSNVFIIMHKLWLLQSDIFDCCFKKKAKLFSASWTYQDKNSSVFFFKHEIQDPCIPFYFVVPCPAVFEPKHAVCVSVSLKIHSVCWTLIILIIQVFLKTD